MKVFLLIIIIIITYRYAASEELSTLDKSFNRLIDSGLMADDMHRRDLFLPKYNSESPRFNLSVMNKWLDNPLSSNEFAERLVKQISGSNSQISESLISNISTILDNKSFNLIQYDDFLANEYINTTLGINLDSAFGFPASLVVKQYLIPMLKAYSSFERDILWSQRKEINFLKKYADSIIYSSNIDTDNPFKFHNSTNRLDSIAEVFFNYAELYSETNVNNIGFSLYLHFLKLNQLTISNLKDLKKDIKTTVIETNLGKIAIGGPGDDTYTGNYILIIELGGNDKYNLIENNKNLIVLSPIRCLIDLSGNDSYNAGDYALGGAYFGINMLLDYAGDDKYNAGNVSLGSAYFGLGILHDFAGKDTYTGKNFSQGAASFGTGILIDGKGNDVYNTNSFSQGFGFTKGFGMLNDVDGDDKYISKGVVKDLTNFSDSPFSASQGVGLGYEPFAGGGIGFLVDVAGKDHYICDSYGQGAGYWYSLGALFDLKGDDNYHSCNLSQGMGIKYSFGNLNDLVGNDKYDSGIISQGFGYDLGYGSLIDFQGNDSYKSKEVNPNFSSLPSVSVFVDVKGNDSYNGGFKNIKDSDSNIPGHLGIVKLSIDGGGNNTIINSNKINTNSSFSFYPDLKLPANINHNTKSDLFEMKSFPKSMDSLYFLSISRLGKFEKLTYQARDSISSIKFDSVNSKINSVEILNKYQLKSYEYILNRIFKKKNDLVRNILLDSLKTNDVGKFGVLSRVLSRYYPLESKLHLTLRLNDKNPAIRELVIIALSKMESQVVADNIALFLDDKNTFIRAKAANTIGTMKQLGYLEALTNSFLDSMFFVRKSAFSGVVSNLSPDFTFTKNLLTGDYPLEMKQMLIYTVVQADFKEKEFQEFLKILSGQVSDLRYTFYYELAKENRPKWNKRIPLLIKNETDSELIEVLKNE